MSGTILKNDGWKLLARWILRGGYRNLQPINVGLDASVFVRKSWIKNRVKKTGMGSFLTAHVPYSRQMELEFLEGSMGMIKVLRDPRDVILSWAHYIPRETAHFAYPAFAGKSLEERIRMVIEGYTTPSGIQVDGFAEILRRFEGWNDYGDCLLLHFEDLVGLQGGGSEDKQKKAVNELIDFIDIKIGPERIESILQNAFGGTKTFRKGKIGSWSKEFPEKIKIEYGSYFKNLCEKLQYL
jgi:hypothetical protein